MQVPSTFSDIESEEELTDGKLGKGALLGDSLGISGQTVQSQVSVYTSERNRQQSKRKACRGWGWGL